MSTPRRGVLFLTGQPAARAVRDPPVSVKLASVAVPYLSSFKPRGPTYSD